MEGLKGKINATFFYILVKLNFHSSPTRANRGSGCMVKNPCERTVGDLKHVWSGSVCHTQEYESAVIEQGTQKNYPETHIHLSIYFINSHLKIIGNIMFDINTFLIFYIDPKSTLCLKLKGNTIFSSDYNDAIFQNLLFEMSENEGDAEPGAIAGVGDSRVLDEELLSLLREDQAVVDHVEAVTGETSPSTLHLCKPCKPIHPVREKLTNY